MSNSSQSDGRAKTQSPCCAAAHEYANRGWWVFPLHTIRNGICSCGKSDCTSPGKHPLTPDGFKSATVDHAVIDAWWRQHPDANVGIATGEGSGFWVLDVDPRHRGDESLAALIAEYGQLPFTMETETGGGGAHPLFRAVPGLRSRTRIRPGLDVRSDGGYIVAPPSLHVSGKTYRWRPGSSPTEAPLAHAPDWLLSVIKNLRQPRGLLDRATRYANHIPPSSEGSRNVDAFRIAGHLRAMVGDHGQRLTEAEIVALMASWNARCSPPLPEAELLKCIESSRVNGTPRADKGFVGSGGTPPPVSDENAEPLPLPDEKPGVAPFDFGFLPRRLQAWVRDIAERMQCPADFLFVAVVVVMATLIGRKVGIRPKRFDVWLVVVNLWGGVIGRSGIQKTPALEECLRSLKRLEREADEKFQADQEAEIASNIIAAERRKQQKQELREVLEQGGDGKELSEKIAKDNPKRPRRTRYIVNDSTVEMLGEILKDNRNGVLVYRDELVGFLHSLDKQGQESARGFYLEAWNGDSDYTYDRIGRGTVRIEAAIVSILGGIQPGPLHEYLVGAARDGKGDDGLLQRFQLLVWPDPSPDWVNHDREPDKQAQEVATEVFRHLHELDPAHVGATYSLGDSISIPYLRFSKHAQPVFDAWRRDLELYLRSGAEGEAFESLLAKYRKLVPAMALIFHLADGETGPVGLESLERAIKASEYLKSHARRVYAVTRSPEMAAARTLAKHLLKRDLEAEFPAGAVLRKGWSGLTSHSIVERAANVLVDLNWLFPVHQQGLKGRPRERYRINPKIYKWAPGGTDETNGTAPTDGGPKPEEGVGPDETDETRRDPAADEEGL